MVPASDVCAASTIALDQVHYLPEIPVSDTNQAFIIQQTRNAGCELHCICMLFDDSGEGRTYGTRSRVYRHVALHGDMTQSVEKMRSQAHEPISSGPMYPTHVF